MKFSLFWLFCLSLYAETVKPIAELVSHRSMVQVSGPEGTGRSALIEGSTLFVGSDSFAMLYFLSGAYLKTRGVTELSLGRSKTLGVNIIRLKDGVVFLNLPSDLNPDSMLYEIETPLGFFSARNGDFLIRYAVREEALEVLCTDGVGALEFNSLEYAIRPGEKLYVYQNKVWPRSVISGLQNRELYSWYREDVNWPLPEYFRSLSFASEDQSARLTGLQINGFDVDPVKGLTQRSFSSTDLIMGKLRIEGELKDKLPHQIVQYSLDGGVNFFDLDRSDKILIRQLPEQKKYNLILRLRDLDRFYTVIHPSIEFVYHEKGSRILVQDFLQGVQKAFDRMDAGALSSMLEGSQSFGFTLLEELEQEFKPRSLQRLDLELKRFVEMRSRVYAEIVWNRLVTLNNGSEPQRESGTWKLLFSNPDRTHLKLLSSSGSPVLNQLNRNRLDRSGPRVFVNLTVSLSSIAPAGIPLVVEDDLSLIESCEYFIDRIGQEGKGTKLNPNDGVFDEKRESIAFNLPLSLRSGQRIFLRAKDRTGNWGEIASVRIVP